MKSFGEFFTFFLFLKILVFNKKRTDFLIENFYEKLAKLLNRREKI